MTNKTMERQNAAKTVGQVFQGQGPLTEEEEQQFKELIEDVAEFNKRGRFKDRQQPDNEEQQPQKVEIELSTDGGENPEEETEEEDDE
ncbi:hypothetical protein [Haloplanus natans]|uniref:hypothetical protein n=1 Tax=Haloplanus natans TaxID=376171 RepID=UPI000677ECD9|nr:hypothetical protein [Haloplanus natans]